MKSLSLWQPWAQLIADGKKTIETRSWRTVHRGELAIHAASVRRLDREAAVAFGYDPDKLMCGAILCVVDLMDCQIMTEALIKIIKKTQPANYAAGNFAPGRYAWHLGVKKVFVRPIPASGKQMLWEWKGD
jgi:hypothetical protein